MPESDDLLPLPLKFCRPAGGFRRIYGCVRADVVNAFLILGLVTETMKSVAGGFAVSRFGRAYGEIFFKNMGILLSS